MKSPKKLPIDVMSNAYRFFKHGLLLLAEHEFYVKYITSHRTIAIEIQRIEDNMKKGNFSTTFINHRLSEKQKHGFAKWAEENYEQLLGLVVDLVRDDHKLTISTNTEQTTFFVTVTCKSESSVNKNCAITSRHYDLDKAILLALYKHFVIFQGESWEDFDTTQDWG